ncbi:MAG: adenylate/guanylate cyclase domain-containing protein [Phycisphaerales bacterium]|nr:MAG: adenylate/guanylate cyclase domain-containing protein [Phycisphaerales bacterium]
MSKHGRRCLRGLMIGLVTGATALAAWHLGWLESWEAPTWTWRAHFFARREIPSPQVKLILLDQASLDWAQRENGWGWPWPREVYGAVAAFCQRGGARALALDLLFTEPSVYGVPDDEAMGEALRGGPPAILPVLPGGGQTTWPAYMARPDVAIDMSLAIESPHLLFPVAEIAAGAAAAGHATGRPDADGIFRRLAPFCRFGGVEIPALGLAAWMATFSEPNAVAAAPDGLRVGSKVVPLDRKGHAILRFRGENGLPEAISAAAIVQSELRLREEETPTLSPETFKDCYVFMGCSAPSLLDLRPVPVNPKCPGVVLHTTFVDNLLTDSFISEANSATVIPGVMATAILASLCLTYAGRWWQAGPLTAAWLGLPMLIGFAAYDKGWWWPIVPQETAVGLGLVGTLAMNYWAEGRQKAFLKQAFRHYLSGEVIEKILRDPKHLQLGGEKRELTIMFTDLAGFSTFSEKLGPVELTALLNDYLSEMTDIILEEGGTLDKYEGDAIIAFWNAPLEQADHAVRACRAALRCQRRLNELRPAYQQRTGAALHMRVGLNTGPVVVGNMGSRKRFNYTILGDAANLAARLEGANKAFGTETMVAESTWRLASAEFQGRKLADLRVVGRQSAVAVYELVGLAGEAQPTTGETFESGLTHFRAGAFAEAATAFKQLPDDPAAQQYARRCAELATDPPAQWDGVWELTQK